MQGHRIRVWLSESYWTDTVFYADTWFAALGMAQGSSPIGQAVYLGETV